MNTYSIALSSLSTTHYEVLPQILLLDHTEFSITLGNITESVLPMYVKIDWGGGDVETFDNNLYMRGRALNNIVSYSPVLDTVYKKECYPSSYALYKEFSIQVLIHYVNGEYNWFVLPILLRSDDYFDSIRDLTLENINILPTAGNRKEYQFIAEKDDFLVEMRDV